MRQPAVGDQCRDHISIDNAFLFHYSDPYLMLAGAFAESLKETARYQRALRYGIAVDILSWPKKKRSPRTPVEIRQLEDPLNVSSGEG